MLISAITESGAVAVTRQLALAMPEAKLFGTAGLAETTLRRSQAGWDPGWLDPRVTSDLGPRYAGEHALSTPASRAPYGAPEPDAIYGYEAMSLMLGAISRATRRRHVRPRSRSAVSGRDLRHARASQRARHLQHRAVTATPRSAASASTRSSPAGFVLAAISTDRADCDRLRLR